MIAMDAASGRCRFCGAPYTGLLSMTDELYTVPDIVPVCDGCSAGVLTIWLRPVCAGHVENLMLTYHRGISAWDKPSADPDLDIPRVDFLDLEADRSSQRVKSSEPDATTTP